MSVFTGLVQITGGYYVDTGYSTVTLPSGYLKDGYSFETEPDEDGYYKVVRGVPNPVAIITRYEEGIGYEDNEAGPAVKGYEFLGWATEAGSKRTVDSVSFDELEVRKAVYAVYRCINNEVDVDDRPCTVNLYYSGNNIADETYKYVRNVNVHFDLSADKIGNRTFKYWAIRNNDGSIGNVISREAEFAIQINESLNLIAVFEGDENVSPVESEPVVLTVTAFIPTEVVNNDTTKLRITTSIARSVDEDYEVLETGALYIFSEDDPGEFTTDTAGVKKTIGKSTNNNDSYTLNVVVTSKPNKTMYVRGYVVVKKNSELQVYYSDIKYGSYNSLKD